MEKGIGNFAVTSNENRYYIQTLLYAVKAPKSFKELRSYEGRAYLTFQEACLARGLLKSNDEWNTCLTEAVSIQTESQLRRLFVTILLGNSSFDSNELFIKHVAHLFDDCNYRLRTFFHVDNSIEKQIISLILHYIQTSLQQVEKTLTDYFFSQLIITFDNFNDISRILAEEMNYNTIQLREKWNFDYVQANAEQKLILDVVIITLHSQSDRLFFIDDSEETEKTFVKNLILAYVHTHDGIALSVASFDIASILLDGDRTSHARFRIFLDILTDSNCNIKAQSIFADLLRRTTLIIWNEASAQNRYCFEAVNRTLKDLRNNDNWFGGITMIFAGIFSLYILVLVLIATL